MHKNTKHCRKKIALISEKNIKAILRRMKEFGGEVSYRKVENKNKQNLF